MECLRCKGSCIALKALKLLSEGEVGEWWRPSPGPINSYSRSSKATGGSRGGSLPLPV